MVYHIYRCMSLQLCLGEIFILDSCLAIFGEENVLLAFCLWCVDCGAITFSASFFPFDVLERTELGYCNDS